MSDRVFEVSLTSLTLLVFAWIIAGIGLAVMGVRWINVDMLLLVFLTLLVGFAVLIFAGGVLLHVWGKSYMSRG